MKMHGSRRTEPPTAGLRGGTCSLPAVLALAAQLQGGAVAPIGASFAVELPAVLARISLRSRTFL